MKKLLPIILIIVLAITILLLKKFNKGRETSPKTGSTVNEKKVNRDRGFDRRTSFLKYSEHAECRMNCRKISQVEVKEIMTGGKINYTKSDLKNARCPRYALEGRTSDGQRVRIVYAQCNESTTVVTVIDLDRDYTCHCPGDPTSYLKIKDQ